MRGFAVQIFWVVFFCTCSEEVCDRPIVKKTPEKKNRVCNDKWWSHRPSATQRGPGGPGMGSKDKPAAAGSGPADGKRAGRALQRVPRPFQLQEVKGKGHGMIALRGFRKGEKVPMGCDVFMLKGPDEKVEDVWKRASWADQKAFLAMANRQNMRQSVRRTGIGTGPGQAATDWEAVKEEVVRHAFHAGSCAHARSRRHSGERAGVGGMVHPCADVGRGNAFHRLSVGTQTRASATKVDDNLRSFTGWARGLTTRVCRIAKPPTARASTKASCTSTETCRSAMSCLSPTTATRLKRALLARGETTFGRGGNFIVSATSVSTKRQSLEGALV